MKCPVCTAALRMTERSGVEIDYCPQCRGVWLDRGELDKLIDRSAGNTRPELSHRQQYGAETGDYRHGGKRNKGFLSDLFDFD